MSTDSYNIEIEYDVNGILESAIIQNEATSVFREVQRVPGDNQYTNVRFEDGFEEENKLDKISDAYVSVYDELIEIKDDISANGGDLTDIRNHIDALVKSAFDNAPKETDLNEFLKYYIINDGHFDGLLGAALDRFNDGKGFSYNDKINLVEQSKCLLNYEEIEIMATVLQSEVDSKQVLEGLVKNNDYHSK